MPDEIVRLTADVVAIAPDAHGTEHVLLIKRRYEPFEGSWALPGGHVDVGEDTAEAAARELGEETGIVPPLLVELGAWHTPGRDPRGRYVTVAYRADLPEMLTPVAADDATEAVWWPMHEALAMPLAFDHAGIITTALADPHAAACSGFRDGDRVQDQRDGSTGTVTSEIIWDGVAFQSDLAADAPHLRRVTS
ncbi:NUDIX hydrolase [Saccharomonospora piscinae]|uniref:NUDIX domain-containing protein n=1 Tax=Saccharomonospora piscinae TaxID=687388 RepID=UPI00110638DA|nr:NUDIX hydrolase [Saccharomonospora piscinae]TLW89234.1 NUDIX hydrolase [Saccharomonospora piscinae]